MQRKYRHHLYANTKPNRVGCAIWLGPFTSDPQHYAKVYDGHGRYVMVHRITWRREHGSVPPRLRNLCGRYSCINPAHWEELIANDPHDFW